MENIHMLRDLLKKDDYLVKIDLKDAYFTVAIWANHQKFLRFKSLEGDSLRVPMPSIRSCFGHAGFHEDNETGGRTIAPVGDSIRDTHCNLSRRHAGYGPDSRHGQMSCNNNYKPSRKSEVHSCQYYQKSVLIPSTTIEFLGFLVH